MKKRNGFTLVELLAVIVILAIILVIAVPQIMNTIASARKSAFEASAKMIASGAENWYQTREVLGESTGTPLACATVAKVGADITSCTITFASGVASVEMSGTENGKFDGCHIENATKTGNVEADNTGNCATS